MSSTSIPPTATEMLDKTPLLQGVQQASPVAPTPYPSEGEKTAPAAAQVGNWQHIPQELRNLPQWVVAGPDKAPSVLVGEKLEHISIHDRDKLYSFETACQLALHYGGDIGYVLNADDPFCCIDLDVKDASNEPDPHKWTTQKQYDRFNSILEKFDSYTERSRSGKGMHVWVKGNIGQGCRRDGVEVYSQERFIICTGNTFNDKPIEERPELLEKLVNEIRGEQHTAEPLPDAPETDTDDVILERARGADNAAKFNTLWRGDFKGYPSQSEADNALMSMLAFYSHNNEQCKRLFRQSGLGKREKATKDDRYLNDTLKKLRSRQAGEISAYEKDRAHWDSVAGNLLFKFDKESRNPKRTPVSGIRLISEDEMATRPPIRWCIHNVLPEKGVAAIYGPPGSGKSFLALSMLGAIAGDRHIWFGHKVKSAPVVYVALEGKAGIPQRVQAYRDEYGPLNKIKFVDAAMDLRLREDRATLINTIKAADWDNGVLCIDTLAASAPGMEENSSTDMGIMIAGLQELQEALGGCIVIIHHTGKDRERGLRGWSGLTGALDGAIEVSYTEISREWKIAKSKDGEDGKTTKFDLKTVPLGTDEYGSVITSCVVVPGDPETSDEETTDKVLALIAEYYGRREYIACANNSPKSAYKILSDDKQYPQGLSKKLLTTLLREAERAGDIEREEYKDKYRHTCERWKVK